MSEKQSRDEIARENALHPAIAIALGIAMLILFGVAGRLAYEASTIGWHFLISHQ